MNRQRYMYWLMGLCDKLGLRTMPISADCGITRISWRKFHAKQIFDGMIYFISFGTLSGESAFDEVFKL